MLRTYRTNKGTELPILNLRGKDYLEVKYRLVWFREEHPDWRIRTHIVSIDESSAICMAEICDSAGAIMAMAHKCEDKKGFPDFLEKAETGAIGRALALVGFGTQFCADELDEGKRIVDSPVEPKSQQTTQPQHPEDDFTAPPWPDEDDRKPLPAPPPNDPGEYKVTFGKKYKGIKLKDIPKGEIQGYLEWLEDGAAKKGLPTSDEVRFLKVAVGRYLGAGA